MRVHLEEKFRVRAGRHGNGVEFIFDASRTGFALTTVDGATEFDDPIAAEQAIQQCPNLQQFSPVIESYESPS